MRYNCKTCDCDNDKIDDCVELLLIISFSFLLKNLNLKQSHKYHSFNVLSMYIKYLIVC